MDDAHDAHDLGEDVPAPAERLRARARATDRAGRFATRLAEVQRVRQRRRQMRRMARVGWLVWFAGVGGLVPLVVTAVVGAPTPGGAALLVGVGVGALVGWFGPVVRDWLARRRGAQAWDAYHERYVLFGDPSVQVRDADRPGAAAGGPPTGDPRRSPPHPPHPPQSPPPPHR